VPDAFFAIGEFTFSAHAAQFVYGAIILAPVSALHAAATLTLPNEESNDDRECDHDGHDYVRVSHMLLSLQML
jgi:hypothetical protein